MIAGLALMNRRIRATGKDGVDDDHPRAVPARARLSADPPAKTVADRRFASAQNRLANVDLPTPGAPMSRIGGKQGAFAPPAIEEVVATIERDRPDIVFAPHVETASGMILPDSYLRAVADAVHRVGGLFVLDCIASGTIWVDMAVNGVDVLISAPQKGWSAPSCCGLVMLSPIARDRIESTISTSFACDLRKWLQIMETYEGGGHAYHATMPTDALAKLREAMKETQAYGFEKVRAEQQELGAKVRALLVEKGIKSVAAEGFQAPGVVVSYTEDAGIQSGRKFLAEGLQTAAGVPLQCDEGSDFQTFRIGLFGLDKLHHIDRTVANLRQAFERAL